MFLASLLICLMSASFITVFSFEIGKEHKRLVLKCMCKGESLRTHGSGSGTKFLGGCKEGWYNCREQPTLLTTCCKEKKKEENPTDVITSFNYAQPGAPGYAG